MPRNDAEAAREPSPTRDGWGWAGMALALLLWVILTGFVLLISTNDPHWKPSLERLISRSDPQTWIIPAAVAGPPLLLAIASRARPRLRSGLAWSVTVALLGVFLVFLTAARGL